MPRVLETFRSLALWPQEDAQGRFWSSRLSRDVHYSMCTVSRPFGGPPIDQALQKLWCRHRWGLFRIEGGAFGTERMMKGPLTPQTIGLGILCTAPALASWTRVALLFSLSDSNITVTFPDLPTPPAQRLNRATKMSHSTNRQGRERPHHTERSSVEGSRQPRQSSKVEAAALDPLNSLTAHYTAVDRVPVDWSGYRPRGEGRYEDAALDASLENERRMFESRVMSRPETTAACSDPPGQVVRYTGSAAPTPDGFQPQYPPPATSYGAGPNHASYYGWNDPRATTSGPVYPHPAQQYSAPLTSYPVAGAPVGQLQPSQHPGSATYFVLPQLPPQTGLDACVCTDRTQPNPFCPPCSLRLSQMYAAGVSAPGGIGGSQYQEGQQSCQWQGRLRYKTWLTY